MPAVGFSVAVTSLVGKYIGAGDPDTAAKRARLGLLLGTIYMTVCAVLFVVFRFELVGFYISAQGNAAADQAIVIQIGAKLLICAAIFQTFDALGIIYSGALRGAGDTVWPGVITIFYSWTFIVGGGWLLVHYAPQLESVGPWIGAGVYIIVLGITMAWRFEAGRWRSISLLKDDQDDDSPHPASPGATVTDDAVVPPISGAATPDEPAPAPGSAPGTG
jgi:MATE family multidrug resistance protein